MGLVTGEQEVPSCTLRGRLLPLADKAGVAAVTAVALLSRPNSNCRITADATTRKSGVGRGVDVDFC